MFLCYQIHLLQKKSLTSNHSILVSGITAYPTTPSSASNDVLSGNTRIQFRSYRQQLCGRMYDDHQQPSYLSVLSSHHSTPFPSAIQPAAASDPDAQADDAAAGWADPFHDDWPHW